MGISIEHNTKNTRENGNKCVRIWKRREMRILDEIQIRRNYNNKHVHRKGGQTYGQGHAYNKTPCERYVLNSQEKKKESKKVVMNTKPHTNHAALATQVERQVEKKSYTHDTDAWKQANREGMCVRETEAIIGKAPRLGIHTPTCPRSG